MFKKYSEENLTIQKGGRCDRNDIIFDEEFNDILRLKKGMFSEDQVAEIVRAVNIQNQRAYEQGGLDKLNKIRSAFELCEVDEFGESV